MFILTQPYRMRKHHNLNVYTDLAQLMHKHHNLNVYAELA